MKHAIAVRSLLLLAVLAGTAQASDSDPWEAFNRPVFHINETLDRYTLKPLAQGYQKITPQPVEKGVHNVFRNIGDLGNLANDLLQGKLHAAGVDTSRLLFNTTFGLLGFFDVASEMGLARNDEDFGQTLGYWGVSSGPYLMLPLLGPSSLRDAVGRVPDSYLGPYLHIDHVRTANTELFVHTLDTRASLLPLEKVISGDKYIFVRNAYLQNREFRVNDGQVVDDF